MQIYPQKPKGTIYMENSDTEKEESGKTEIKKSPRMDLRRTPQKR